MPFHEALQDYKALSRHEIYIEQKSNSVQWTAMRPPESSTSLIFTLRNHIFALAHCELEEQQFTQKRRGMSELSLVEDRAVLHRG